MNSSTTHDDFQTWDTAWSSLSADHVQLFTRSAPRTLYQFWQRCYVDDLWPFIQQSGGAGRYLEVGSGRGTTSMYLASRGCDVTLLDYSANALAVAQANFAREGLPKPGMVVADARATGLASGGYDCVYSLGLLEHFDDPKPVMDEMLRLLKPGGWLYAVIVPDRPASVRYLTYCLFAPWRLIPHLVPAGLRRFAKRILRGQRTAEAVVLRTELGGEDYVRLLPSELVTDAQWYSYNPYHKVYNSKTAECWILVPVYRLYRAIRQRFVRPSARTVEGLASCYLLTCRKKAAGETVRSFRAAR